MAKELIKVIAGNPYDFTLCPRCQVWILTEDFDRGAHPCDKYFGTLQVRRNAEARIIQG